MVEIIKALVRPVIALAIVFTIIGIAVYLVGKYPESIDGRDIIIFLLATGATVIGFYFGERSRRE